MNRVVKATRKVPRVVKIDVPSDWATRRARGRGRKVYDWGVRVGVGG